MAKAVGMTEQTGKITALVGLERLIRELRVAKGRDNIKIADELERRGVAPLGWTAFRVQCIVRGFKIYRKWGCELSRSRRAWNREVAPHLDELNDRQRAAIFRLGFGPAAKRAKRNGSLARHSDNVANANVENAADGDWPDEPMDGWG